MSEGVLSYWCCLTSQEYGFSASVSSVLLPDFLFILQLKLMDLDALCPDWKELGLLSHLPISFSSGKCHIFLLVYPNILLHLEMYRVQGWGLWGLDTEAHFALPHHCCICRLAQPVFLFPGEPGWMTAPGEHFFFHFSVISWCHGRWVHVPFAVDRWC